RAPLALRISTIAAVTARRLVLLGVLRLSGVLALVDPLGRVVVVLGLGVRRRAVALVDVAVVSVTSNAHRCVDVRLDARSGRRRRTRILVDLVLCVLVLLRPLRMTVGRLALAVVGRGRSLRFVAGATASASFLITTLALSRALLLGDSLRRG